MCILIQRIDDLIERANNTNINQMRKLCVGIAKYLILSDMFENKKINDGFMNLFLDFYVMKFHKDKLNRDEMKTLLQEGNANNTPEDVMARIRTDNTNMFSYATKVLHTIDPSRPIYDSRVAVFFDLGNRKNNLTYTTLHDRYTNNAENLRVLATSYEEIIGNDICRNMISYGNDDFTPRQALKISEVKKIDFMIWAFA